MKQIIAFIKPNKLPAATLALQRIEGLSGMSFSEVRGFGSERMPKPNPPIVQDLVDYAPYVRMEIFCPDDLAYEVQWTLEHSAHTGQSGDGKIFVLDLGEAIRIQTHEHGEPAL